MHVHTKTLPILLALGGMASACDADCENPKRLDGSYVVWSFVSDHSSMSDDYPSYEVFYNGWSEWTLTYVPSQKTFNLELDEQPYTAGYQSSDNSCNRFSLSFEGRYVAESGSEHDFAWSGDLIYLGQKLGGTWTYESSWSDPSTGANGTVNTKGQLTGTTANNTFDTGF